MWEIFSVVSNSLWPHGLYNPWNSLGQNTGVGSLSLFQGIFPTQRSNPGLPHFRLILNQLNYMWSPKKGWDRVKDGRIGGCEVPISSQVHQKYVITILREHLLDTSGGPQPSNGTRKVPMQPDRTLERNGGIKVEMGWDWCPWGEAEGEENVPIQKSPLMVRGSVGTKRDFRESGKCSNWSVDGKIEKDLCTLCCNPAHPSLSYVSPGEEVG